MATTNSEIIAFYMLTNHVDEEIHTFAGWKKRGFSVKKGEHSKHKFSIWKYVNKKVDDEDGEKVVAGGHCVMKMSHFFTASQVEPLKA